jgi:hypothetical protein
MRRLMAFTIVPLLFLVPTSGHAAATNGCSRVALGNASGGCLYFAGGNGAFFVSTVSGFIVQRCPAQYVVGATNCQTGQWVTLAFAPASVGTGVMVTGGPICTAAGDLVHLGIFVTTARNPLDQSPVLSYQDGFITGSDVPTTWPTCQ